MPQFETYDGTKDPNDHLHAFYSIMQAQNASDALMCKIFTSTLRGNARTWYYSLQPNSISSYAEMAAFFATKFSSRRLIKKTTSELMRVTQREGESLKNYMNRFSDAVLEIGSFSQVVGLAALIQGLKHDRFRDSLIKHAPSTFDEANERSWKFIQAEEYALSSKPAPNKEVKPPTWRDEGQNQKRFKPTQNRGPFPPKLDRPPTPTPQPMAKHVAWTPFNLSRSQILMQIKNKMELRRPLPMRSSPASRDHNRYCDFHQDHGHTTEECNILKYELEGLAPPSPLPPPSRIIHMITRGPEAGGTSSKQQKLYVREVKHHNRAQKRKFDETNWKNQSITFSSVDFDGVVTPHNDPLVTSVMVNNCEVQCVLVNTGSAPDIMYYHYFESLGLDPALLQKYDGPIYGFNNQPVPVEGILKLNVTLGSGRAYVIPSVQFLVVKMASSFIIVIGRPTLTKIRAVVSPSHLCMKFLTPTGVATLRGNQEVARHCYMTSVSRPRRDQQVANPEPTQSEVPATQQVVGVKLLDNRLEDEARATPAEEVEKVQLDDRDPTKKTQIGTKLSSKERAELIDFLKSNKDVFAWTSADMLGIPTSVAVHKLETIKSEVEKLLQAGFVRRVDYCEWVANPILVKKSNGQWRMCIDYTNLNEVCPKDCHPLPSIDKLVEAASENERLSLLDAYSGYHQVHMAPEDEAKTSFYAGDEIYCYVRMPFGLKNAGATYQKMVTIVFRAQIGRNLEVYVDDIVVKSPKAKDHPAKCVFGVESSKFLGFMVSKRGIEVNPEKIKAIEEMKPPKLIKDVQRLAGRIGALHRFVSKSAEKCLLFFKILRSVAHKDETGRSKKFDWTLECQTAFNDLKSYLGSPPLLTKAEEGEILYLYFGISNATISSILVKEASKQQKSVYYASKVLQGAKLRYSVAEKAALAIFQKPECSGRLIKWAVELGKFQITFQQRSSIRAQALVDFVVECTSSSETIASEPEQWTLYVDGSSSKRGSRVGTVLLGLGSFRSEHALKFNFEATNNMVEYEALLLGLRLAAELKVRSLQVYSDSQLIVNQVNSTCEVTDLTLVKYLAVVLKLKSQFVRFQLTKISSSENGHADSLSKLASDSSIGPRSVFVKVLDQPSFQRSQVMKMKLRRKASRYTLVDGTLYKRSYSLPLLRCLIPYEADYALCEVHEGVCGSHVGARTLAHKVLRQGYYWPNKQEDAKQHVQKCPKCQFFAHLTHQPTEELTTLVASWPFAQWGIDLLGPFVKGTGGVTHLVMAVDYFTKWVEARPLSSLTSRKIEDFVFSSVICRYGIPNQVVADNGPQFNCTSFKDFYSRYRIKLVFTSVYHLEANGMVESVNKAILEGIKPRLDQVKAKWSDELNNVLWAYRTTSRTATGQTPYHLAFGIEAVIPVEMGVPSLRVTHFDATRNEQLLRENLDFLDEIREEARLRTLAYKQKLANSYNRQVRPWTFRVGDFILRKAGLTSFKTRFGKLVPNWEGLYVVAEIPHPGAYILVDAEGKRIPRVWNVNNLKKFYP
ncbi:hypothetical protein SLEP1_g55446 [Rubroshorea leprosula]|uniref:Uncharacterized protein n=1 Tax=Rubroshorea leprosula TaxID=152421 RepID=A0AAV5MGL0_9ROSI|nr:hypothetical protein SLEP1_g55446 [Rubroshorea leprosula]